MIDHVEALLACRPIDRRYVDDVDELASRIVTQERRNPDDIGSLRIYRQFAARDRIADDRTAQSVLDCLSKPFERVFHAKASLNARSCRFGGFFSATTSRHTAALPQSADSRVHRCRLAQYD